MNNGKLAIIQPRNLIFMCEYYGCNNRSEYIVGNSAGPQSMVHTLCKEHMREIVAEGNKLFPDIADLDLKVRAAQVEAETTKADLSAAKQSHETAYAELEERLKLTAKELENKLIEIDSLKKAIVDYTLAKSQGKPENAVKVAQNQPVPSKENPKQPQKYPAKRK